VIAAGPLPYDPYDPPVNPPPACRNRLMWQLARRLFADHQPASDGWCAVCRPFDFYPCVARQLADIGLEAAYRQPDGAPWRVPTPTFDAFGQHARDRQAGDRHA
jgi:hypothetical protein